MQIGDRAATHKDEREYLPAMGRSWLLPLYDPLTRLAGIPSLHGWLLDHADIRPGQRVLEVGCGTGNLLLLAKRRRPDITVAGLDPDGAALKRAQRKFRRANFPVQLEKGLGGALPYPDDTFDRVLSALMFHHLAEDEKGRTLREVRRVLRQGGELHLLDFGGGAASHHGMAGRRLSKNPRLRDNLDDGIPERLREAGFADTLELGQAARWMGRFTHWRSIKS